MNYIKTSKDIKGIIYNYLTINDKQVKYNKLLLIKYLENAFCFHNGFVLSPREMKIDNLYFLIRYKFDDQSLCYKFY